MNEATKNDNKLSNFLNVVKKSIESTENIIVLYKDADEKLAASFVSDNFTKDFVFIQYGNNLQLVFGRTKVMIFDAKTGATDADIEEIRKYNKCIYFIQLTNDIEMDPPRKELLLVQHILKNMSGYQIGDIVLCGQYAVPVFFSKDSNATAMANAVFLNILNGIGDFFVLGSVYLEYIKELKKKGKSIYLTYACNFNPNSLKIHETFFQRECPKMVFHNYLFFRHFMDPNNTVNGITTIDNWSIFVPSDKKYHVFDIDQKYLLGDNKISPYKYADYFNECLLRDLPNDEKEYIDNLVPDDCIGFQFYTGRMLENGEWSDINPRCWDEDNVNKFINLCNKNGHKIAVLSPHPYQISGEVISLNKISVLGYMYAASKMKYMVGIDSSAGHIAAFYNIPNLTIWGNNLGLFYHPGDDNAFVGFRCMRNNVSIMTKSNHIKDINALNVYSILEKMLRNDLRYSSVSDIFDETRMFHEAVYIDN